MIEHNFKIGDKVKLNSLPSGNMSAHLYTEGIIGVVTEVGRSVHIKWDTDKCIICGSSECGMVSTNWYYGSHEIKKVFAKGQQLLFDFMERN